jgi:hypothetical protein
MVLTLAFWMGFANGVGLTILAVMHRRWLLYNARCLRGRRCIHGSVTGAGLTDLAGFPLIDMPDEAPTLRLGYLCERCGTEYAITAMMTSVDGDYVVSDPERV